MAIGGLGLALLVSISFASPARGAPSPDDNGVLSIGGGVADFVHSDLRAGSGMSGAWAFRFLWGIHWPVAVAAEYFGTLASAPDPLNEAFVLTSQITTTVRLQYPRTVAPFLDGGVGWINLHRNHSPEKSPVAASTFNGNDSGMVVPLGGGVAVYPYRKTMLEVSGHYDLVLGADGFSVATRGRPDMWHAELRVGTTY